MSLPSFIFGKGTGAMTPEDLKRRREFNAANLRAGMSTAPVQGGVAEGIARVLQGALGGYFEGRDERLAGEQRQKAGSEWASSISGLLGGGTLGVPSAPATPGTSSAASVPIDTGAGAKPVDLSGDRETFVASLMPAAIEQGQRTGVDPRIIVAQAAQETGWGRSAPGNNYFGIKSHGQGGGQNLATQEVINGQRVKVRDSFRTFASPADSVAGYGDFLLANPRYKPMMQAQGLDAQLQALGASGYATDPNYARSVGAIARGLPMPAGAPAAAPVQVASNDPSAGVDAAMGYAPTRPPGGAVAAIGDLLADNGAPQAGSAPLPPLDPPRTVGPSPAVAAVSETLGFDPRTSQATRDAMLSGEFDGLGFRSLASQASPAPAGGAAPNVQSLVTLLSNPWLDDSQRSVGAMLLERELKRGEPPSAAEALAQERFQYEKDRDASTLKSWQRLDDNTLFNPMTGETRSVSGGAGATPTDLGLNPQTGVDANGNPVLLQLGKDGRAVQTQMPDGVTLSKEPIRIDAGTHVVLLDPITRQPIANVAKDIAGAAAAEVKGKTQGERSLSAPGDVQSAQNALDEIKRLREDPNRLWGTGFSHLTGWIPGTPAYDYQNRVKQAKAGAFLQAIQSMRGLGALSNVEGEAATAAINRMDVATSEAEFLTAVDDYEKIVKQGMDRARKNLPNAPDAPANPPPASSVDDLLKKYGG